MDPMEEITQALTKFFTNYKRRDDKEENEKMVGSIMEAGAIDLSDAIICALDESMSRSETLFKQYVGKVLANNLMVSSEKDYKGEIKQWL